MSYLVLARKYRPRNFTEMVGQEHVVQALSNALTSQRLHHAYLFTGTRGVGKTTVSRILAKSLNCQGADGQGGITAEPCGVCQACRDIDSGRFVDYTELDAASNRGVDEVQTLLEQAVYKPVQGRFKVFMIDEVHMLTNTAFNAMLKTLEEPPEYLKFVLATTDPQKVPVTVLSRCLQFNLRPMAPETVYSHLQRVLEVEAIEADAPALRLLSRAARGSMRDALSLTDQAIAFGGGLLQEANVRQMLGSVDRGYVFRLLQALAENDGKTAVDTCTTLREQGLSAASTLEDMANCLQRMAVLQAVPDMPQDDSDPDSAEIARLAEMLPPDETQLLYSMCLHGRADLGLAPDEYAALSMVMLRFLTFKPGAEKKTPTRTERTERAVAKPPVAAAPTPSPTPVAVPVAPVLQVAPVQPTTPSAASASPVRTVLPAAPVAAPVPVDNPPGQRLPVRDAAPPPAAKSPLPWEDEPTDLYPDAENESYDAPYVPDADEAELADDVPNLVVNRPVEPMQQAVAATKIVAMPVRELADAAGHLDKPAHANTSFTPTPEGDFWFDVVSKLDAEQSITAFTRQLAIGAQLVARDEGQWQLRVENQSLDNANARERLATILTAAGHAVRLVVEVGRVTDCPQRRMNAASAEKQQAAERIIHDHPFVQTMVQQFGARVVPGTLKPLSQ
ncbi:DNA polymerase III subunit gamma/tau [Curvibacter sp. CHRR-16]|uniref:DNA polymerase III subunit gamma/tau n=1 Tax=Curvibacter sp. CHRR-16 TaxID=2835872 RepID=UPI001BD919BB|nr:DNA polymerase III subunit gamma/tau [Curvibacter sp. CHRR-16]MBT0568740.1 DNA polymerase III subunit gamma/tau [Curvibacter sp. CHRR-16]